LNGVLLVLVVACDDNLLMRHGSAPSRRTCQRVLWHRITFQGLSTSPPIEQAGAFASSDVRRRRRVSRPGCRRLPPARVRSPSRRH
jgi:hypothetical protein